MLRIVQQAWWGGVMLTYRCPKSGKIVRTSVETTSKEVRRLAEFKLSFWCPHCDDAHVMLGKDVTVAPTLAAMPISAAA